MTDPQTPETPVDVLKKLRLRVGSPSGVKIEKWSEGDVSKSTVSLLLSGKNVRDKSARGFIRGCLAYARTQRIVLSHDESSIEYWYRCYTEACESSRAVPESSEGVEWVRRVEDHVAWRKVESDDDGVRDHAVTVARHLFQVYRDAERSLIVDGQDPWHDPELAQRMSRWMTYLISWLEQDGLTLTAAEAALLALAPFAHQADVTRCAALLIGVRPTDLARSEEPDDDRRDYETFLRSEPNWRRLVSRAHADDLPSRQPASHEIGWWLFHRWVDSRLRTSAGASLCALLGDPAIVDEPVREELMGALGRRLLRGLRRHPDELRAPDRLGLRVESGGFSVSARPQEVREQLVGLLVVLAHALAIDVTTLPSRIVEHLGVPDPVKLTELRETVRKATWGKASIGLGLTASCRHEAVWEALREHAAWVDAVLCAVHAAARPIETLRPLRALPARVSADHVESATDRLGRSAFATPVSGFRLDEERIRELLMGKQLYRDPALAIRELYQNALDACRYRTARLEFRSKQEKTDVPPWKPTITFVQRKDQGRHYLECTDNGVGMDETDLRGAFSQAGLRFTDRTEFLEEQEQWRKSGVKFFPNSRFGIGVMSYFMLADEIEIETRPMDGGGRPQGPTLTVNIVGPGHLFRIKRKDGEQNEPGTRVRLYLNDGDQAPSCVDVLRRLLGIAEFKTIAGHHGRQEQWEPGVLKARRRPAHEPEGIDVSGELVPCPARDDGQVIWCEHGGALLVDGIYVRSAVEHGVFADPNQERDLRGAVVNLTRGVPPKLSVDRTLVLDNVSKRVEALMNDATHTLTHQARFLCVEWIHDVAESSPWVADLVTRTATEAGVQLLLGGTPRFDATMTGIFPPDLNLLTPNRDESRDWKPQRRQASPREPDYRFPTLDVERVPDHIALWRLVSHHDDEVLDQLAEAVPNLADRVAVVPAIPSDAALLANNSTWSRDDRLGLNAPPPPGHLLWVAAGAGITPQEAAQRAALLGMREVHPDRYTLQQRPDSTDLMLLSENLDGKPQWLTTDKPVHFGHLLDARRTLKLSVTEATDRLRHFGFHVQHAEHLAGDLTTKEIQLLSHRLTGEGQWLDHDKPVAFAHLVKASLELGYDITDAAERLARFGFTVVSFPDDLHERPTTNDLQLLSRNLNGHGPWLDRNLPVSPQHLIEAAHTLDRNPRDVAERLAALGFTVRCLSHVPDQLNDIDQEISNSGNGTDKENILNPDKPMQPIQLFWIATALPDSGPQEVAERLTSYGFEIGDGVVDKSQQLTQPDLKLLSRDYDGEPPWLDIDELVSAAHFTRASLETDYRPRAAAFRLAHLGFTVAHPDSLPDQLTPRDVRLLSVDGRGNDWLDIHTTVPLHHLTKSARRTGMHVEAVAQRLRDLGLSVPDLADTIRDSLPRIPRR